MKGKHAYESAPKRKYAFNLGNDFVVSGCISSYTFWKRRNMRLGASHSHINMWPAQFMIKWEGDISLLASVYAFVNTAVNNVSR